MITLNGTFQNTDFLYSLQAGGGEFPTFSDEFEFRLASGASGTRIFRIQSGDLEEGQNVAFGIVDTTTGELVRGGFATINSNGFAEFVYAVEGATDATVQSNGENLRTGRTYRLAISPDPDLFLGATPDFEFGDSINYTLSSNDSFDLFSTINYSLVNRGSGFQNATTISAVIDRNDNYSTISGGDVFGADQYRVTFSPTTANVLTNQIVVRAVVNVPTDSMGNIDTGIVDNLSDFEKSLVIKNSQTGEVLNGKGGVSFSNDPSLPLTPNGLQPLSFTITIDRADFGTSDFDGLFTDGLVISATNTIINQDDTQSFVPLNYNLTVEATGQVFSIDELERSRVPAPIGSAVQPLTLNADNAQLAYVAYYGRPADPAGLQFWSNILSEGGVSYSPKSGDILTGAALDAYNRIVNDFGNSPEAESIFGSLMGNAMINQIYQFNFNRNADATGLAFWSGQLESGGVTLASAALEIALGAEGFDVITLNNKISSATIFTNALDTAARIGAYSGPDAEVAGRNFLAPFGTDVATTAQANVAINALL